MTLRWTLACLLGAGALLSLDACANDAEDDGADLPGVDAGRDATVARDAGGTTEPEDAAPPPVVDAAKPKDAAVDAAVDAADAAPPGPAADEVFDTDSNTLARFELNGDLKDTSGNGRNGVFFGPDGGAPTFVNTSFGKGLTLAGTLRQGIDWSAYANLLGSPFTIELVFTESNTTSYRRLFTHDLNDDNGLYTFEGALQCYPDPELRGDAGVPVKADVRTYVAVVYTPRAAQQDLATIYVDGVLLGTASAAFTAPPTQALFFEDNANNESLVGTVEAIRVSKIERSAADIKKVQDRLAAKP